MHWTPFGGIQYGLLQVTLATAISAGTNILQLPSTTKRLGVAVVVEVMAMVVVKVMVLVVVKPLLYPEALGLLAH